jgi:hypothetical protein
VGFRESLSPVGGDLLMQQQGMTIPCSRPSWLWKGEISCCSVQKMRDQLSLGDESWLEN